MDDAQRDELVETVAGSLETVIEPVLSNAFQYWKNIDEDIGQRIEKAARSVTAQTDQQPGGDPLDNQRETLITAQRFRRSPDSAGTFVCVQCPYGTMTFGSCTGVSLGIPDNARGGAIAVALASSVNPASPAARAIAAVASSARARVPISQGWPPRVMCDVATPPLKCPRASA